MRSFFYPVVFTLSYVLAFSALGAKGDCDDPLKDKSLERTIARWEKERKENPEVARQYEERQRARQEKVNTVLKVLNRLSFETAGTSLKVEAFDLSKYAVPIAESFRSGQYEVKDTDRPFRWKWVDDTTRTLFLNNYPVISESAPQPRRFPKPYLNTVMDSLMNIRTQRVVFFVLDSVQKRKGAGQIEVQTDSFAFPAWDFVADETFQQGIATEVLRALHKISNRNMFVHVWAAPDSAGRPLAQVFDWLRQTPQYKELNSQTKDNNVLEDALKTTLIQRIKELYAQKELDHFWITALMESGWNFYSIIEQAAIPKENLRPGAAPIPERYFMAAIGGQ